MSEREDMLAMVASLYYELDQSQTQIANRLGVSSSKISRMLKEARDRGIVHIRVEKPVPRDFALEQQLIELFGLRDAHVLQTFNDADETTMLSSTGRIAASYLWSVIPNLAPGASIGVAWGTGVHATVSALPDNVGQQIDVVQLMGGVGALMVDGPDLARMVATKLGGRHYDLHSPLLVERPETRTMFLNEPVVRDAIRRARAVQLAITGIGTVQDDASSFLRAGLLTRADLSQLRHVGAVGEMVGRFFDASGHHEGIELNQRIVGIELEDLQRIPQVLAIARGITKAQAIHAALIAGYLTVLATDDVTARAVLALSRGS
ncbi:MAG: sugar-binding transcriptional regulator [Caldilineaceae bacterium]|nr:sugar-binding transcriptional regulator [Caldilineaceae bacterium]